VNWDNIRYLLALASAESLSGAARQLGVSHVTVARRIEDLETELGASLFTKTPTGYRPTALAKRLLEPAAEAERGMLSLQRVAQAWDDEPAGLVRLAIAGFLGPLVGVPAARRLREVYPNITLDVIEGQKTVNLQRYEADLAMRLLPPGRLEASPSLRVRKLGTIHWSLWASPSLVEAYGLDGYPHHLGDLPLVGYDEYAPGQPGQTWIEERTDTTSFAICANSMTSVEAAVRHELGAGVLPNFIGQEDGLVRLSEPVAEYNLFVVIHPDMARSNRVQAVADVLCDYIAHRDALFLK
jgi:DNA-binding transcriptional LysR family regulator